MKFNGDTYIACGTSPRVRTSGVGVGDNFDNSVYDLIEFNGELIAGGSFDNAGATVLNGVAKWDGISWQPLDMGLDGTVFDLEIWDDKLVAVGSFEGSIAGNMNCNGVAVWNGLSWDAMGTGLSGTFGIQALKALANGPELIIGGSFSSGNGVLSPNVIKWNGSNFEAIAGGVPEPIGEIAISAGKLYIANAYIISNSNFLLRLD
jgi:hypothetical protein